MPKKYNYTKKTGAPSKYKPKYCKAIIDYFDIKPFKIVKGVEVAESLRFTSQFARKILKVHVGTLYKWASKYPEFGEALKAANKMQEEHLVTCALRRLFNPTFAIFSAKNMFGWRDVTEVKGSSEVTHNHFFHNVIRKSREQEFNREAARN